MSARPPTPARIAPRPTRGGGGNGLRIVVTLVVIGLVLFFAWRAPNDPPPPSLAEGGAEAFDAGPVEVPICRAHGGKPFVVGEAAATTPGEGGAEPERFAPFSVELGRGTRVDDGFVVGLKRDLETDAGRGAFAEVVILDAEAQNGRLLRLGRIRGDLDAPLVVPSAKGWVAAFVEPLPRSLALKLVRPDGEGLHWGAEIEQGHDESLAFDVAMGGARRGGDVGRSHRPRRARGGDVGHRGAGVARGWREGAQCVARWRGRGSATGAGAARRLLVGLRGAGAGRR